MNPKLIIVLLMVAFTGCAVNMPSETSGTPKPEEPLTKGQPIQPQPIPPKSIPSKPQPPVIVSRVQPSPAVNKVITQATSARKNGRYDYAMLLLDRAQRMAPKAGEVYLEMARVSRETGQLAKAEQLCLKAISLSGQDQRFRRLAMRELAFIRRVRSG